jgi:hypothetical protein
MKHLLIIPCLLLCSCPIEEEAESSLLPNGNFIEPAEPSLPSSSSVEPTEPSILDCPPEDIAEYPVSDEPPPSLLPSDDESNPPGGMLCIHPKLSVEELLFSAQGGVRCVTTDKGSHAKGDVTLGCRTEYVLVSDTVNNPPHFIDVKGFNIERCPWFTVTRVADHTFHISVNQNETEKERKMVVAILTGACAGGFMLTQSPD